MFVFQVMYITATSPYILMLILLVRGLTLDGASDGIRFYLEPSAEKLRDQNVRTNTVTKPLEDLESPRPRLIFFICTEKNVPWNPFAGEIFKIFSNVSEAWSCTTPRNIFFLIAL